MYFYNQLFSWFPSLFFLLFFFLHRHAFSEDTWVKFSNLSEEKIIGTYDTTAHVSKFSPFFLCVLKPILVTRVLCYSSPRAREGRGRENPGNEAGKGLLLLVEIKLHVTASSRGTLLWKRQNIRGKWPWQLPKCLSRFSDSRDKTTNQSEEWPTLTLTSHLGQNVS